MAKYYCILFDADNTLLNFDAAENKALTETLVNYGIEPDAETVQTYRTINEELWRQLEKGQIRREKLRIAAAEVQPVQPLRQSRVLQRAEGHELRAERR